MILAVDFGSTSFKAAVVDERLRVRGFAARPIEHQFGAGGKVEIGISAATATLKAAIRAALTSSGMRATRLHAVAVTSQAQTFTIADKQSRARMPFISWQDNRATSACDQLKKLPTLRDFGRHCSFGSFGPALQLCQLRHLQATRPGFIAPTDLVLHLPTYFVRQWTGASAIDENLAAMSGLYSLSERRWWPAALRVCGLRAEQLPGVHEVGAPAVSTDDGAAKFGLPGGIPVVLAGNDQTAGAYAAQLDKNHGLLITLGTSLALYLHCATMPRPNASLFRGPFPGGWFYRMAADGSGGNIINWAKTILGDCETDEKFFRRAAGSPPGSNGVIFDPGGNGAAASWRNLALHHTAADLARAVLEGLTLRAVEQVRQLVPKSNRRPVFIAGGGSENPLWVRMLSAQLGVPCRVTEGNPCLGAARMALRTVLDIQI